MKQVYKLLQMKVNSSSRLFKTVHRNGSYLLLSGKSKVQSFEIPYE